MTLNDFQFQMQEPGQDFRLGSEQSWLLYYLIGVIIPPMIDQQFPTSVVFLACKVFEGIVSSPEDARTQYLDYGLHTVPKKLKQTVQEQINAIKEPSLIILGYGLCGNGLHEIEAGAHTLVIPKRMTAWRSLWDPGSAIWSSSTKTPAPIT